MIQKLQQLAADKRAALRESEGGFTLIELLVVVVIIGILIAIAIPLYLNYQKGAHDKSAQSDLRAAVSTLQQCYSENSNAYPDTTVSTAVTSSGGTAITDMTGVVTFKCGSTTEEANLSDGTHMRYVSGTNNASFQLYAWNTGGNKNADATATEYKYDSAAGGTIS